MQAGNSGTQQLQTRDHYRMLIGGQLVDAVNGRRLETTSPFTGRVWAEVAHGDADDVDLAVRAAQAALDGPWGRLTASERGHLLYRFADVLREHADELATTESIDNGKLLRETSAQVASLPAWYEYFGGLADKVEGSTPAPTKADLFNYTRHEPIGVVGIVLPWNSPLLLLTFKVAPALAAGCTVVIKPSEYTPVSAIKLASLFDQAGFPAGVVNVVTGARDTGAALIAHPDVAKIAFTGSTVSGIAVMQAAADHLASVSLELGGKSPNIVFDDADLDAATNGVIAGIFAATGQACVAGSRLLVARDIQDEVVKRVHERATTIRLGDPLIASTEMGPCANQMQLTKVIDCVERAKKDGATVVCGGQQPTGADLRDGYFYEPTVLADVTNDMDVAQEEIFGPVLAVIPFDSEAEAISLANDTRYGLAAGIWTKDVRRAHRVAHQIKAGVVWVNCYRMFTYNMPFGGYKWSGIGRDNGMESVKSYMETKSVWVNLSEDTRDPFLMG